MLESQVDGTHALEEELLVVPALVPIAAENLGMLEMVVRGVNRDNAWDQGGPLSIHTLVASSGRFAIAGLGGSEPSQREELAARHFPLTLLRSRLETWHMHQNVECAAAGAPSNVVPVRARASCCI